VRWVIGQFDLTKQVIQHRLMIYNDIIFSAVRAASSLQRTDEGALHDGERAQDHMVGLPANREARSPTSDRKSDRTHSPSGCILQTHGSASFQRQFPTTPTLAWRWKPFQRFQRYVRVALEGTPSTVALEGFWPSLEGRWNIYFKLSASN
jgi:hypothetical protein